MNGVFKGRSLCVIDDFTIEERLYLFEQTRLLKQAIERNDLDAMDRFRLNDGDFGIYEVFLEDSTRTKEFFRNAAVFHRAKVSELMCGTSSFNKGESYRDTFNMLSGYRNAVFIVRSKVEGVCRWLEESGKAYAARNQLPYRPAYINAGDGKHEHPTQELLDEFTFLEDNQWSTAGIHLALVGDLYHGRTVHSKVDGLRIFKRVQVDLVAPDELAMPAAYIDRMKRNGFEVRTFSSIEAYLQQDQLADKWYFTRPQLERMGERILQQQESLRRSITMREELISRVPKQTVFYHPLPRHKDHPTVPSYLDATSFNGWERQACNGMYVRIVLLGLVGGKIGADFVQPKRADAPEDAPYILQVDATGVRKRNTSEGVNPIDSGMVIDHVCKGERPSEIRKHLYLIRRVLKLDQGRGGDWVSTSRDGASKGLIFCPNHAEFSRSELKKMAAVAPGCTLNCIKNSSILAKYRMKMPPRIYNFSELACRNENCISHPSQNEGVPARFERTPEHTFCCAYCGRTHTFKEIWSLTS